MYAVIYGGLGLFAAFFAWIAIDPEGQWHRGSAWAYRDPGANEPSPSAFAVRRVTAICFFVAMVACIVVIARAT